MAAPHFKFPPSFSRPQRELTSGVFGTASFGCDCYDLGLISRVEQVQASTARAADGVPQLLIATAGPFTSGKDNSA